ncbi:hypothetical protein pdam_00002264 [Pocillopora damicornis]|uniref:Uncharacterized protein n=1 Tax=Pocillopora damicornis TaxID=46731 RepID=A0A3M6TFG0_POCDA|nr:hypothetical protein pdam_00002264 [Pocillopora damicornis]
MDQFYEIFDSYAEQLAKLPMLPVLQCVHYIIMNLKLRMGEGLYAEAIVEAHRAKNILKGVEISSTLYHDAWLVMIAVGTAKGAGSRLLRPVVMFAQGKVDAVNEALYPSFVTKLSIVGSILFIVVQKRIVAFTTAEVLLGITCVGAFLQVLMYLSNTSDPFTYLEKAVAAVLFKEPAEKADTSDAKKKKE